MREAAVKEKAGRRWSVVLLAATLMTLALPSSAHDLKIAYVNAVKVLEEAPQGAKALKRLEAEFGPRDRELVAMQDKIKAMEDDLDKNGAAMKDADRHAKEREIINMKRDLRRATQEFREDYNMRKNEELTALQKVVYKAIVDIAKQDHYDLILHEGTIYASNRVDITDKVLKRLGKK